MDGNQFCIMQRVSRERQANPCAPHPKVFERPFAPTPVHDPTVSPCSPVTDLAPKVCQKLFQKSTFSKKNRPGVRARSRVWCPTCSRTFFSWQKVFSEKWDFRGNWVHRLFSHSECILQIVVRRIPVYRDVFCRTPPARWMHGPRCARPLCATVSFSKFFGNFGAHECLSSRDRFPGHTCNS
jgi:hypothetical protein